MPGDTNSEAASGRNVIGSCFPGGLKPQARETRSRMVRGSVLLVLALALSLIPGARGQSRTASEYELKAAFLFNFAKFVEWPAGAFSGSEDPIRICLLGGDPFAGTLEQVVHDKMIGGRKLQVTPLQAAGQAKGCHVLFVSAQDGKPDRALLHGGYGPSMVTVGETSGFAGAGGVIDFVQQENRLVFEINAEAADRAGVKLSAKLLSLAKIVRDDPAPGKE
jgi:hypothetical protein